MLSKKNRADKKTAEKIFKQGKFINSSSLNFKFIPDSNLIEKKISFIVPKNINKSAVVRNRLRRRGYIALEKYFNKFPPLFGVFVFKKPEEDISKLENEIKIILDRIN